MPDNDLCLLKIGGRWKDGIPRAPWSRYVPPCPNYEKFSKEQLDMRRKAYVLNYNQRNSRPKKNDAYIYFSKHPKNIFSNYTLAFKSFLLATFPHTYSPRQSWYKVLRII